jgi:hypothetical protein
MLEAFTSRCTTPAACSASSASSRPSSTLHHLERRWVAPAHPLVQGQPVHVLHEQDAEAGLVLRPVDVPQQPHHVGVPRAAEHVHLPLLPPARGLQREQLQRDTGRPAACPVHGAVAPRAQAALHLVAGHPGSRVQRGRGLSAGARPRAAAGGAGGGHRVLCHVGDLLRRPHPGRPRRSRRWRLSHMSRHVMPGDTTHGITPQATAQVTSPRVPGPPAPGGPRLPDCICRFPGEPSSPVDGSWPVAWVEGSPSNPNLHGDVSSSCAP